jgi:hypothetical protein
MAIILTYCNNLHVVAIFFMVIVYFSSNAVVAVELSSFSSKLEPKRKKKNREDYPVVTLTGIARIRAAAQVEQPPALFAAGETSRAHNGDREKATMSTPSQKKISSRLSLQHMSASCEPDATVTIPPSSGAFRVA